jgi:hypothetical protein
MPPPVRAPTPAPTTAPKKHPRRLHGLRRLRRAPGLIRPSTPTHTRRGCPARGPGSGHGTPRQERPLVLRASCTKRRRETENDHAEAHVPRLALAPIMAVALPIAATASAAPVTVTTRATSAEPVGGPNHSPFSCPAAAAQASAISASSLSLTGRSCSTRGQTREASRSRASPTTPPAHMGKPFTLRLTDTVDGALSPAATPEPREP